MSMESKKCINIMKVNISLARLLVTGGFSSAFASCDFSPCAASSSLALLMLRSDSGFFSSFIMELSSLLLSLVIAILVVVRIVNQGGHAMVVV